MVKAGLKSLVNGLAIVLVAVPALACRLEAALGSRTDVFVLCGQTLALLPGLIGKYLRRAFYHLTLARCPLDCDIGFLTHFSQRGAELGRRVYIGPQAIIAGARIADGVLIGSRASILSGGDQHEHGADGRLSAFDPTRVRQVSVGRDSWIGEGAVLMADIGERCIVAAGAVVSMPVPDGVVVGGNPARFVRRVDPPAPADRTAEAGS